MGKFKNNGYLISDIMRKKEEVIFLIVLFIIVTITMFLAINIIHYQREVVVISINNSKIYDIKFGFQTIPVIQGLFNPLPKGNLRLNYGIKDNNLNEIIYIGQEDKIGDGSFFLTNLKFPLNNSWEIRFELKDMNNLTLLDKKCYLIKFEVQNGVRKISQENCYF